MLLLLKGASGTLTATIAGVGAVVASGSTVSATLAGRGDLIPPESIELMISADIAGVGGVLAISQGFLSRSASVDGIGIVTAFGGFGATLTLAGMGGVTGTVGSFFDGGAVALAGTGAVSAAAQHVIPSTLIAGTGAVAASPIISGGTISSAAVVAGTGSVSASTPLLTAVLTLDGQGGIQATGGYAIATLATQMRLSFSADEIRTFFRRG